MCERFHIVAGCVEMASQGATRVMIISMAIKWTMWRLAAFLLGMGAHLMSESLQVADTLTTGLQNCTTI